VQRFPFKQIFSSSEMKQNGNRVASFPSAQAKKPDTFFRLVSLGERNIFCFTSKPNENYNMFASLLL
jgi:hypothetical protein